VDLNHAVAVSMASGPQVALGLLDPLLAHPLMQSYHLLPSVRGDLLARLGRHAEASVEFSRAASLTRNSREQKLLVERTRVSEEKARNSA
jgi:predicted RNA polymerase sigma factor